MKIQFTTNNDLVFHIKPKFKRALVGWTVEDNKTSITASAKTLHEALDDWAEKVVDSVHSSDSPILWCHKHKIKCDYRYDWPIDGDTALVLH